MSGPWIAAVCAITALVIAQATAVLAVLVRIRHRLEQLASRLEDARVRPLPPAPGTPIPDLELLQADGRPAEPSPLTGAPAVLLLVSAACAPCHRLLEQLTGTTTGALPAVPLIVVADSDAAPALLATLPPGVHGVYQRDRSVTRALAADRTPLAIGITADRRVSASKVPGTVADLADLAATLTRAAAKVTTGAATEPSGNGAAIERRSGDSATL